MNFLNPLYLFAAITAAVPIIIHLLHRQRVKIEEFPSLEFVRKMLRRKTKRFRLKQLLLLIMRTLIVLFIALALARPTLMRGSAASGHLPTTAVIVLDNSFSMGRREANEVLFDAAKEKTLELLDYFDRKDEVFVMTASAGVRALSETGTGDMERLRRLVAEASLTYEATDLAGALRRAATIVNESENPNREIYLVSDMQRAGWRDVAEKIDASGSGARLLVVDLGEEIPNSSVRDLTFRIPSGTDDLYMDATFARSGGGTAQGRVAEVFIKETLLERTVFSPGEGTGERERFRLPPSVGLVWGDVRLAPDKLEADDIRFFALMARTRRVAIMGDSYYIRTALSPEGGGLFRPAEIEEGGLSDEVLSGTDILVLSNVVRLLPMEIEALARFVEGGGSVLIFLGNRVDTGAYNRNLLPVLGDARIEGLYSGEGGYYVIERFEREHPAFAKFKSDENPFEDIRFYSFMRVDPGGGSAMARFTDGSASVVQVAERVVLFTFPADDSWTDFPLATQFLPFVHEMGLFLSSSMGFGENYTVGEEVVVRVARREGEAALEGPTGTTLVFPQLVGHGQGYRIDPPAVPGVYFLTGDRETLSVFAVNVDAAESDLSKISTGDMASDLEGLDVSRIRGVEDIGESISVLRRGRELSHTFIWLALILLLAETVIASSLLNRFRGANDNDAIEHLGKTQA
jgi:hypothetical protein